MSTIIHPLSKVTTMSTSTPIDTTSTPPPTDPTADPTSLRLAARLLRIESQLAAYARCADLDPQVAILPSGLPSPLGLWLSGAKCYISSIRTVIDPDTPHLPNDPITRLPHWSLLDIRLTNLIQELVVIRRATGDEQLSTWLDGAITLLKHTQRLVERHLADSPLYLAQRPN